MNSIGVYRSIFRVYLESGMRESSAHLFGWRGKTMETPAINELRQRKKKSDERENSFEKEYEIPPSETEKETLSDVEREKETLPEAEREKGIPRGETTKEMPPNVERGKEIPPNDDVCPICFGDYTIPCKTNCGHWFCGLYFNLRQIKFYYFGLDFLTFILLCNSFFFLIGVQHLYCESLTL